LQGTSRDTAAEKLKARKLPRPLAMHASRHSHTRQINSTRSKRDSQHRLYQSIVEDFKIEFNVEDYSL